MTDRRVLTLMLAPYAVGLVALVVLPLAVTIALALTDYDLVGSPSFVGLDNVRELVGDDVYRTALRNSLLFAVVVTPLRLGAALGLALLLQRPGRGVTTARAAVVLPTVMPEIAYGLLWLWLLNPLYGPINTALTFGGANGTTVFGGLPPQWLTDPGDARLGIVLLSLFTIGEGFVLLLVARRAIPADLYEAAELEAARSATIFGRLTLPLMTPALVLLALRDLVLSFQLTFVPVLVVTEGGPPLYATTTVPLFSFRNAFEYLRYGYAATATLLLLALTFAAIAVQWWWLRRWRFRLGL